MNKTVLKEQNTETAIDCNWLISFREHFDQCFWLLKMM